MKIYLDIFLTLVKVWRDHLFRYNFKVIIAGLAGPLDWCQPLGKSGLRLPAFLNTLEDCSYKLRRIHG